jgi:hypothetical protein
MKHEIYTVDLNGWDGMVSARYPQTPEEVAPELKQFIVDQGWDVVAENYGAITGNVSFKLQHPHYKTYTAVHVTQADVSAAKDICDLYIRCVHRTGEQAQAPAIPEPRPACKHAGERERRADFTGIPTSVAADDSYKAVDQRNAFVQQLQEQALASLKCQLRDWPVCNLSNTPLTIEWDFVRGVSPGTKDTQEAYWHCAHCQSEKGVADDTAED